MEDLNQAVEAAYEEHSEPAEATVETPVEQPVEEPVVEEIPPIEAPGHWKKEDQERFAQLGGLEGGREWQEFLTSQHKAMVDSHSEKMNAMDRQIKLAESIDQMFQGTQMNPMETIQQWSQLAQNFYSDPKSTLLELAEQYNVDLNAQEAEVNPEIKALQDEIKQLKGQTQTFQQSLQTQRAQEVNKQIESFAGEQDADGNPKHPYFDDVVDDMVRMIKGNPEGQPLPTLAELYETAVYANPTTRKALTDAEAKKREAELVEQAKKSKQASRSLNGSGGDSGGPLSLDDAVRRAYELHGGA